MNATKLVPTNTELPNELDTIWNDAPGKALIGKAAWPRIAKLANLTRREIQVCRLIFEGKTRQEAAEELKISTRTIRHHLESVHLKLEVTGRVGLVLRLVQLRDSIDTNTSSVSCSSSTDSRKKMNDHRVSLFFETSSIP